MTQVDRRDARVNGALKVMLASDSRWDGSVTRNISQSGLFLVTRRLWPVGEIVYLRLAHRFHEGIVQAQVCRADVDGVGFKFLNLDESSRNTIKFMIDGLLNDGGSLEDRRRFARTQVGGPIVWRVGTLEVLSRIKDLSLAGAAVETTTPPEIGAQIYLYLPGKDGSQAQDEQLAVHGSQAMVIFRDSVSFGAEFVFPSLEFKAAVSAALAAESDKA